LLPLIDKSVLDVGCRFGDDLARVRELGAPARLCHGVDILLSRIEEAQARHPELDFACADARDLPYEDDTFDLALASVVFSSILDWDIARVVAREIVRVVRPTGAVIWYDNRYANPWNRHVRRYAKRHLRRLSQVSKWRYER
jgi:ubiquinone/menaquinone biosynthesis C-methylase UbiE